MPPPEIPPPTTYYPWQCAICGARWNKPDVKPKEEGTHLHTEQDWINWANANGMDPASITRPYWVKIAGVTYPDTPPILPPP